MSESIEGLVALVQTSPESSLEAWRQVDALVARGRRHELVRLAVALNECPRTWLTDSVGRRLVRRLALTAGLLEPLLDVIELGAERFGRTHELEDMVAQRGDVKEFVAALRERARQREFFAGLMQSLVCTGLDLSAVPEALVFRDELVEQAHPLALLPLAPTPLEAGLVLGRYSVDAWSSSGWGAPTGAQADLLPAAVVGTELAPEPLDDAVRFWGQRDLGRFRLERRPPSIDLRSLPLECVSDARTSQAPTGAPEVFARLFSAASGGGAYGGGEGNARARRSAFRSVSAFCRDDDALEVEEVVAEAARCSWWLFFNGRFFANVAWDLGVACLRSDGVTLLVLAATDTD